MNVKYKNTKPKGKKREIVGFPWEKQLKKRRSYFDNKL